MSNFSQTLLIETLQKPKKNLEDAQLIYENIRSFRFFENFFAQNLRSMDHSHIMALCKEFGHEHIPIGRFVFQKGDPSNNKFYVILSGKIGIVIPRKDSITAPRRSSIKKSILKRDPKKKLSIEPLQKNSPRDRSQSPDELPSPGAEKKKSIILNDSGALSRRTTFIANQSEFEASKSGFNINLVKVPEQQTGEKASSPLKQVRSSRRSKTFHGLITSMSSKKDSDEANNTGAETEATEAKTPLLPVENIPETTADKEEVESPREEEEEEEVVDYNEFRDKTKFEEYASKFGVLVRYMGAGESFGELALKNNAPRSASVLCSEDCEFLVITKQQFELIFEKKDREKEEFLKSTFPFLASMSAFISNYVLLSFKTELYKKGNYLAKEEKVNPEESKFFLIHKGECLVEKVVSVQLNSPLNKNRLIAKDSQTAQISVIGQGTIAGEEILMNKDNYNYSVKTLSDGVLVHTVSKKDFDSIFFKDFHEHLISMYLKKKKQRDIIFENVKKDHQAKADELKAKNIYSVQNTKMNNVLSTPALQSLSRYMHREQNNMSNNTPVMSLSSPKNNTFQGAAESFGTMMARNAPEENSEEMDSPTLEKKKFPKVIDLRDPNRQNIAQRLEYLNKFNESPRRRDSLAEPTDFSSLKLFETEPSRKPKSQKKASIFMLESPVNRLTNDGGKESPMPSTFKEAAMKARDRPRNLSLCMPEPNEMPKFALQDEEPSPLLKMSMPISPIQSLAKVGESKQGTMHELGSQPKTIANRLGVYDFNGNNNKIDDRINYHTVLVGNNGNISGKYQQQNEIKMFGRSELRALVSPRDSNRVSLPKLKTLNLDKIGQSVNKAKEPSPEDDENSLDGIEGSTKGQTTYMRETDRPAFLSSRVEKRYQDVKMSPEIKSAKGLFSFQSELENMLKGYRSQHTVRLKVIKDSRSKVFQKTSGINNGAHHKRIASDGVNSTKLGGGLICSPIGMKGKISNVSKLKLK